MSSALNKYANIFELTKIEKGWALIENIYVNI